MKEEDYVMKLMATYGALRSVDEGATQRSVTRRSGIRECERQIHRAILQPFQISASG